MMLKRLGGFFVAVVATFSLVVSGFVPVFAAESVPVAPFEAADLLSARVQAGLRHHRVLIGDELEADSSTWVNPDGTLTTEVYGSPVRVRDVAGRFGWRDLDFTLVFASDGSVVARSGLLPLRISGGGSAAEVAASGLVSVSSGVDVFGFGWAGGLPKPVLLGRYNGNFGKHLKSSRFTTLNISNWSPRLNDKYMRLVMSSGLRIITLDNPHSSAHKNSVFEAEMKLLRDHGYKIVRVNSYLWEWRK